jgi:YggT family protein
MLSLPFIHLFVGVIDLYRWVVLSYVVLQLLLYFQVVNSYHPFVSRLAVVLSQLVDPVLNFLRRFIPRLPSVDLSPVVLLVLLGFLRELLMTLAIQVGGAA